MEREGMSDNADCVEPMSDNKLPSRMATPELPRRGQRYTKAELLRAMVLAERATMSEVAAMLKRPVKGLENKFSVEGVRASQGRITPSSLARETGYHYRTIAAVARRLGVGRAASEPGSRKRIYMSESEAERVVDWLRSNSLRDWGDIDKERVRRTSKYQRERFARHESRSRWVVGQRHGEREIVAVEVRGDCPRLMVYLRCESGHGCWMDANELNQGKRMACGPCSRPKLAAKFVDGGGR